MHLMQYEKQIQTMSKVIFLMIFEVHISILFMYKTKNYISHEIII